MGLFKKICSCFISEPFIDWTKIDDSIDEIDLTNIEIQSKVVSVYDGDTIKVVFPYLNKLFKWNCRLEGIDTPELRTKNINEKKYGYIVRDKLRNKILNQIVTIKCGQFDKYGRLLVYIYIDQINVNQWLIKNNYAFAYDGGTKKSWESYLEMNPNLLEKYNTDP